MCRALHPVSVVREGDCCPPERWGLRGEVVAREVSTGHQLISPGPALAQDSQHLTEQHHRHLAVTARGCYVAPVVGSATSVLGDA